MFGHIRIFSPGTSKLRIRQNYFYNIFSGIGYIAASLPITPNNSSIHGCQQASDFSSAPSLLFLRKIYDYIIFFRSISGIFTCEFSICPTYRILTQLCTKCSWQIAMQHRNHRLLRGKRPQFRCHFCQTEKARKTDLSIFRVSNISY